MDTISSAEFRKRYATLDLPTIVTVNGHPVGTWLPLGAQLPTVTRINGKEVNRSPAMSKAEYERFNTQPFTGPIPKKR
jgi:hypothetical protein